MPLYRVETGVPVRYRLGVVTPEGVDFGGGPISAGVQVRLHEADISAVSIPVETGPVSVRLYETSVAGSDVQVGVRLYETGYVGVATVPGPVALTDRLPSPL